MYELVSKLVFAIAATSADANAVSVSGKSSS